VCLRRYVDDDVARGFFAVDVPFPIPIADFPKDQFYKIIGDKVVVFKPQEWRGTTNEHIPFSKPESLSVHDMAQVINAHPVGTVNHIYLTSDGGGNLADLYGLVAALAPHVEVVDQETIVAMALQRG